MWNNFTEVHVKLQANIQGVVYVILIKTQGF